MPRVHGRAVRLGFGFASPAGCPLRAHRRETRHRREGSQRTAIPLAQVQRGCCRPRPLLRHGRARFVGNARACVVSAFFPAPGESLLKLSCALLSTRRPALHRSPSPRRLHPADPRRLPQPDRASRRRSHRSHRRRPFTWSPRLTPALRCRHDTAGKGIGGWPETSPNSRPVNVMYFEPRRRELKTAATADELGAPDRRHADFPPASRAARVGDGASHWSPASRSGSSSFYDAGLAEAMRAERSSFAYHVGRSVGPRRRDDEPRITEHPTRCAFCQRGQPRSSGRREHAAALRGCPRPRQRPEIDSEGLRRNRRPSPRDPA